MAVGVLIHKLLRAIWSLLCGGIESDTLVVPHSEANMHAFHIWSSQLKLLQIEHARPRQMKLHRQSHKMLDVCQAILSDSLT